MELSMLNGELDIHESLHLKAHGDRKGRFPHLFKYLRLRSIGGKHSRGIPGMNSSRFNMLHNSRDIEGSTVANRIQVVFEGILEKMIHQKG